MKYNIRQMATTKPLVLVHAIIDILDIVFAYMLYSILQLFQAYSHKILNIFLYIKLSKKFIFVRLHDLGGLC